MKATIRDLQGDFTKTRRIVDLKKDFIIFKPRKHYGNIYISVKGKMVKINFDGKEVAVDLQNLKTRERQIKEMRGSA
jgi:hypothetical protein